MLNINPLTAQREYTQGVDIDGIDVTLCLSAHALERIEEYGISQWEVLADIMLAGERLLEEGNQRTAAILNMESGITTLVTVSSEAGIYFDVITVMNHIPVHETRHGKKVVRLSRVARIITLNGHY